jgi:hypothetical protein
MKRSSLQNFKRIDRWDCIHNISYLSGSINIVLHYTGLEKLDKDKRSILLDPFVGYEENEAL